MKCCICDTELLGQSDYMASDIDDSIDVDDDYIISIWSCPNCGVEYEMYYPSNNERQNYKYYEHER